MCKSHLYLAADGEKVMKSKLSKCSSDSTLGGFLSENTIGIAADDQ